MTPSLYSDFRGDKLSYCLGIEPRVRMPIMSCRTRSLYSSSIVTSVMTPRRSNIRDAVLSRSLVRRSSKLPIFMASLYLGVIVLKLSSSRYSSLCSSEVIVSFNRCVST